MLGKPVEQGEVWTRERIDGYLRRAGALPLTDYLPEPPTEEDRARLRPEWRRCVRGRVHGSCRDDDVDYAVLGLDLLETHGFGFSTEQVGDLWLLRLPYLQTFTAERAAYRNLAGGLKPPLTATYDNPYQEWIGALIRADVYGWTSQPPSTRSANSASVPTGVMAPVYPIPREPARVAAVPQRALRVVPGCGHRMTAGVSGG